MKDRYTIDNENHLVIKRNRTRLSLNGKFNIDKNNQLTYWLNEPNAWKRQYDLPNKIRFQGSWKLNPNYDLELILDETKTQFRGDRLTLKGEIISIDNNILSFETKSYDKQGLLHIQILRLTGTWSCDEYNRLCFLVKKKTLPDTLTLEGIWQINKNQQIIYTYEKTDLKTKTKTSHTLTFEGFWEINENNRLTYILERSLNSYFDFRVQIESPNLYPQEGVIKYRLGIGKKGLIPKSKLSQSSPKGAVPKIIYLFGTWKLSRKAGLIFQMDYGKDKIQKIEFDTNVYLTKKDEITFSLTNKRKEPLGINVIFTHRFLKKLDAEAFLRIKEIIKREFGIEVGIKVSF